MNKSSIFSSRESKKKWKTNKVDENDWYAFDLGCAQAVSHNLLHHSSCNDFIYELIFKLRTFVGPSKGKYYKPTSKDTVVHSIINDNAILHAQYGEEEKRGVLKLSKIHVHPLTTDDFTG